MLHVSLRSPRALSYSATFFASAQRRRPKNAEERRLWEVPVGCARLYEASGRFWEVFGEAGRTLPAPGVSATRAGEESQKGRRTAFRCGSRGGEHAYSSGKAHMEENVASPACAATLKGPRGGTEECQNARANLWTCGGREVSCELRRCTRRPRQAPQVRIESCAAQRRADGTDGRGRRRPKL